MFVQHARKALADLIDMGMVVRGNRTKFGTNVSPVLASEKWDFSIANKRTESVSLVVRTNQNGSDKRTESAPTIDNSTDNKPNTPYNPPAKKRAEAAKDKSEMPVTLTAASLIAEGVEEQTATDFIALRKAKRSPLTATALKVIKAEAAKAGYPLENAISECVTRGWQAFKADWVLRDARPVAQSATSKPSLDNDQPRNYGRSGKL